MSLSSLLGGQTDLVNLGDTFLESYYSVLDWENKQMGFARKAEVPIPGV